MDGAVAVGSRPRWISSAPAGLDRNRKLKRQMCARADFAPLAKRALLAP
ncbi:hypothetical protein QBA75_22400 [Streptomyces stelliscabiei]